MCGAPHMCGALVGFRGYTPTAIEVEQNKVFAAESVPKQTLRPYKSFGLQIGF
jgi:hypothetical protein